jgi:hypothetical protein
MTPPPSSGALTVPEMSADDARFYALKDHDDATTLSAWQTLEAEVRSGEDTPSSLPNVNLDYAVGEVIGLAPTFAKLRGPTLALFCAEQAAKTAKALDALPRLACAILYVLRQEARESSDAPSVSDLNAECFALRALGLRWCVTLENLGKLPAGTAKAIRKGHTSYRETAADLQDLFNALSLHRAFIAKLSADADKPLSDADIDRMARLSTLIRAQLAEDKAPLSWRVALLRLAARLADDYRVAQACAQLYLTLHSDPTSLPTFSALRRPTATTTKPAAQPDPADQPPSA